MAVAGDKVYIGSILTNVHLWGIVSDLDTPSMMSGSFEVLGNDGAIALDALVGPQGVPGENSPIVKMNYDTIDDVADLPNYLTDSESDVGQAWWIGNQVYMWTGSGFVAKAMGTQGPPGPVPKIHPSVQLLDPDDDDLVSEIVTSGTDAEPGWLLKLKAPKGPKGDNARILEAEDFDNSTPPDVGQAVVWNGEKFAAASVGDIFPRLYSIPEAAFTSYTGMTTRHTIGTFQIPPQDFYWTAMVIGHIRAVGVELDADPLILGCEVRLGHSTAGTLIGRGFGNSSSWTTIVPHYSSPQATYDAITPENGVGVVVPNHTDDSGTLYINLFNDGLTGVYNFSKTNAQLAVLVLPVGSIYGYGS